jgi:hypothetical protein
MYSLNTGDLNGCNSTNTNRIKYHYRPTTRHFGNGFIVQPSVLDNVFSDMGTHGNDGFFQHFQLSCYQYQRKESS